MDIINTYLERKKRYFQQAKVGEVNLDNFPLLKIGFQNPFTISPSKKDLYLNDSDKKDLEELQFLIVNEEHGVNIEEGIRKHIVKHYKNQKGECFSSVFINRNKSLISF